MALTGLAIAAALALAKDQLIDQPAAKKKRTLAANTQRNSPWTGLQAGPVEDPNTIGTMMQYGAMGAQMGAGYEQAQADKGFKDAMTNRLNTGGSLGGGWGGGYGKDLTSNALGSGEMTKALAAKPMDGALGAMNTGIAQDASNPYASLYAAGIQPDATTYDPNFFKKTSY